MPAAVALAAVVGFGKNFVAKPEENQRKKKKEIRRQSRRHQLRHAVVLSTEGVSTKAARLRNSDADNRNLITLIQGGYAGAFRSAALQDWTKTQDSSNGCVFGIGKTNPAPLLHFTFAATSGSRFDG